MKLVKALSSGSVRSLRSSRAVLIIWLITLTGVSLLSLPFKSAILSEVGDSMATEMIKDSFSIDFWIGLGSFQSLSSAFTKGVIYLVFIFIIVNIFLNGGLFASLKENSWSFRLADFFREGANNFFAFLSIWFFVVLMFIALAAITIGIPVGIVRASGGSDYQVIKLVSVVRIIFLALLPVLLLVADYARAWIIVSNNRSIFKALGYGFRASFGTFFNSYFFMAVMVIIQSAFVFLISRLTNYYPDSSWAMFLFFIITQLALIFRLYLRALRYGGVITLHTL